VWKLTGVSLPRSEEKASRTLAAALGLPILRVGLENDEDRVVYDLDVETAEPQFSMIGNRLPGGKIKFKTMPRAPKNLPWLVHVQLVRSIATGKSASGPRSQSAPLHHGR